MIKSNAKLFPKIEIFSDTTVYKIPILNQQILNKFDKHRDFKQFGFTLILGDFVMNFGMAISTCMGKYGTFSGRAVRGEFWWFYLFTVLMSWGATIVAGSMYSFGDPMVDILPGIVTLIFLLPSVAAGCRRLHDIGKSGWWQLLWIVPIIGWILLIIWLATDTKPEGDKYNQI